MYTLVVEIYEPSRRFPILVHRFNGMTKKEAEGYFESHMHADDFIRGCVTSRHYGRVQCRNTMHWEKNGQSI